ncbi:MAG: NAD(P)-binding protein [Acidimicrobiales bacterium]
MVGAGAMGMAFTDALVDHADVHVTVVDRRAGPGGHWLDAYPFVRLHQASSFYGVASTELGTGARQTDGPEAGLHERAGLHEIRAYYADVMERRLLPTGKVTFLPSHRYQPTSAGGHAATSLLSGESVEFDVRRRIVDATYLAPSIPATTPAPFTVADGVAVATVNDLVSLGDAPAGGYVIVGSGKTATDAIVWLVGNGVDPNDITWVRPGLDAQPAVVQPDPTVFLGMAADTFAAAQQSDRSRTSSSAWRKPA